MHRDIEERARPTAQEKPLEAPDRTPVQDRARREHGLYPFRGSMLRLSDLELATMYDVGRFRTVALEDLARHRYAGRLRDLQEDVRALAAQGLIKKQEVWTAPRAKTLRVLVLTKRGREAVEALRPDRNRDSGEHAPARLPEKQALYSGFVKRNEVRHDAAIYRMFHAERQRIERSGGRIRRIVLDFELKRQVYAPLAKAKALPPAEYAKLQGEVARANGLKGIHGEIPLPDLRLEYETRSGQTTSVDLELATEHYHGRSLAEKAQAGFSFYAADGSAGKLSQVLEERGITVAILSL